MYSNIPKSTICNSPNLQISQMLVNNGISKWLLCSKNNILNLPVKTWMKLMNITLHERNQTKECMLYGSIYIKFTSHSGGCWGGSDQKGVIVPLGCSWCSLSWPATVFMGVFSVCNFMNYTIMICVLFFLNYFSMKSLKIF